MFRKMMDAVSGEYRTKGEIVADLCREEEGLFFSSQLLYFILNKWWNLGLIRTESGKL